MQLVACSRTTTISHGIATVGILRSLVTVGSTLDLIKGEILVEMVGGAEL